ncbi:MAG: M14 family zinc carboxypeptidase [Ilumatobacteraceae bacterium]
MKPRYLSTRSATFTVALLFVSLCASSLPVVTAREIAARADSREKDVAVYPKGFCDEITEGMPGLNDREHLPVRVKQIGKSVLGRPIWAEYWGPTDPSRKGLETYIIVAQIHGNECSPTLVVDEIRKNPPTAYGVWLIPTLNPDGYANYTRNNAVGRDLNADGHSQKQPETAALKALTAAVRPSLTIHMHSPNAFAGRYGGRTADEVTARMAKAMGVRYGRAGFRFEKVEWFLWQGMEADFQAQSILVELHAVSPLEVPNAIPRPSTRTIDEVRIEIRAMLGALVEPDIGCGRARSHC